MTAKALCATCPVRAVCDAFASSNADVEGVWAGVTGRERRTARRSGRDGRDDAGMTEDTQLVILRGGTEEGKVVSAKLPPNMHREY
jgi:hypothetical protein